MSPYGKRSIPFFNIPCLFLCFAHYRRPYTHAHVACVRPCTCCTLRSSFPLCQPVVSGKPRRGATRAGAAREHLARAAAECHVGCTAVEFPVRAGVARFCFRWRLARPSSAARRVCFFGEKESGGLLSAASRSRAAEGTMKSQNQLAIAYERSRLSNKRLFRAPACCLLLWYQY